VSNQISSPVSPRTPLRGLIGRGEDGGAEEAAGDVAGVGLETDGHGLLAFELGGGERHVAHEEFAGMVVVELLRGERLAKWPS